MTHPQPVLELAAPADRLTVLDSYGILDTPPEQGFDDIVLLATQLCQTPVALVSLVAEDRQWFKAQIGFPHCQTDLSSSVCVHALAAPDLLVIPDLTQDPRTRANPLVTGDPFIRFYAGAPLRTPSGMTLGSLCVIDHTPRPAGLTRPQAEGLQALARQVITQLELRRTVQRRDAVVEEQRRDLRARDVLRQTQTAIGVTDGDLETILDAVVAGAMRAIPAAEGGVVELLDGDALEYRAVQGHLKAHRGLRVSLYDSLAGSCALSNAPLLVTDALTLPQINRALADQLKLRSAVFAPIERGGQVLGVLKLQSSQPAAFAATDLDQLGMFAGVAIAGLAEAGEVSARQATAASETRYKAIFESAIDYAIIVLDLQGQVTNWNVGAEKILGWTAAEMCGKPADVFFTPEDRAADIPAQEMHSALTAGRGIDERWHLRRSGERFWANGEMMALRNEAGEAIGFVKILRDRTEQRLAEERLKTSDERLQMALSASGVVGLWDWIVETDRLHGDAIFARLYGLDVDRTAAGLTMEEYQEFVVEEDLAPLRARIGDVFEHGADFQIEYRLALPGEPLRWVECKGRMIHNAAGRPLRFSGTAIDITARKHAADQLRAAEERYRLASRATNDAIWDWDLASNHVLWNEALTEAYGHAPDAVEPTGDWWIAHIHPEDRDRVSHSIHEAIDGTGITWTDEYRFLRADGSYAGVFDRGFVIRDPAGRPVRMIGAMLDLTERKRAETALRESERKLQYERGLLEAIFQQAPVGISVAGATPDVPTILNAHAEAMMGHSLGTQGDARYARYGALHADGSPYAPEDYPTLRALRGGETVRAEAMCYRHGQTGEIRQFEVSSGPVRDDHGEIQAAATVLVDVTEQRAAEAAARRLAAIVEQSGDFIGVANPDGRVAWVNEAGRQLVGLTDAASAQNTKIEDYFDPAQWPEIVATVFPAVDAKGHWRGELRFRHFVTGAFIPVIYDVIALRDAVGVVTAYATVTRDITKQKEAETQQHILNLELSHRLKNTLAMVQAIATQTLRNATDPKLAREALAARLIALGKAHDILMTGEGQQADMRAVITDALRIHDDGRPGRFVIEGPLVICAARAALSLALMIHELATNAVKYGALHVPEGSVHVTWSIDQAAGEPMVAFCWHEHGGPPVTAPTRKGFGSRLIERGLAGAVGGEVQTEYLVDGLRCALTAPLSGFQTDV